MFVYTLYCIIKCIWHGHYGDDIYLVGYGGINCKTNFNHQPLTARAEMNENMKCHVMLQ